MLVCARAARVLISDLQSRVLFGVLRLDDFAEDLLTALEVALKAYAAGDEKDAYQLTSPFAPYIATRRAARVPAEVPAEVELQVEPRARRAPAPAPGARDNPEDEKSEGEDSGKAGGGQAQKRAKLPKGTAPAPTAPEVPKKRRSGASGESLARKAARLAAEGAQAAPAVAAAAGHTLPLPPGPRPVEIALRTENSELKLQLAKVSEERMALKEQLATLKATVELREQLAIATAKAACGGLMLRAMTSLGGGCARAGSSGVQTPGQDTPVGSSTQQQLAFDSFFGA